jgi:hypothetical protein
MISNLGILLSKFGNRELTSCTSTNALIAKEQLSMRKKGRETKR